MIITEEIILEGRSSAGGWNKAQLAVLGIPWTPPKGWKKSIIGTEISEENYKKFIELKKS